MGVDPGLRATGYAFIRSDGQHSAWVSHGDIRTDAADSMEARLGAIFKGAQELLAEHRPDALSIEDVFLARNPAVAIKMGHARGAVICAAVQHGVRVFTYSAKQIKRAVVGRGSADKEQVAYMVSRLLNIVGVKASHDASDAMAAALCDAHSRLATRVGEESAAAAE